MSVPSIVGFIDASFVALKSFRGEVVPCSIIKGCDIVLQSVYSKMLGQPLALWGAVYYGIFILLITLFIVSENKVIIKIVLLLSLAGSFFSLWLIFIQLFIIKAVCLYCLVSAVSSFTLLYLSITADKTIRQAASNKHVF